MALPPEPPDAPRPRGPEARERRRLDLGLNHTPGPVMSRAPHATPSLAPSFDPNSSARTPGITRPHTTKQTFKLTDESRAEPGRVHAVVRLRRDLLAFLLQE